MRLKPLFFAMALLAVSFTSAQADVHQSQCGRIAGYTEESLVLETKPGVQIVFALDEESEAPVPLTVGARVQVEFEMSDPCQEEPHALYVLPIGLDRDECPPAFVPSAAAPCQERTLPFR